MEGIYIFIKQYNFSKLQSNVKLLDADYFCACTREPTLHHNSSNYAVIIADCHVIPEWQELQHSQLSSRISNVDIFAEGECQGT